MRLEETSCCIGRAAGCAAVCNVRSSRGVRKLKHGIEPAKGATGLLALLLGCASPPSRTVTALRPPSAQPVSRHARAARTAPLASRPRRPLTRNPRVSPRPDYNPGTVPWRARVVGRATGGRGPSPQPVVAGGLGRLAHGGRALSAGGLAGRPDVRLHDQPQRRGAWRAAAGWSRPRKSSPGRASGHCAAARRRPRPTPCAATSAIPGCDWPRRPRWPSTTTTCRSARWKSTPRRGHCWRQFRADRQDQVRGQSGHRAGRAPGRRRTGRLGRPRHGVGTRREAWRGPHQHALAPRAPIARCRRRRRSESLPDSLPAADACKQTAIAVAA